MKDYVIFGLTEEDLKHLIANGTAELVLIFKDGKYSHAEAKFSFMQSLMVRRQFKKWNRTGDYHYELYLKKEVEV